MENYQNQFPRQDLSGFQNSGLCAQSYVYPATQILRHRLAIRQMYRSGYLSPQNLIFNPNFESGIYFGRDINGFNIGKRAEDDGHAAIFGASGAGKTTSIGSPTIHSWKGPIFAIDLKGELVDWGKNREREVLYLLEGKENNYYYDPFEQLAACGESTLIPNARELANAIIPLPLETREPYWIKTARDILTGTIVYFFHRRVGFIQAMEVVSIISIVALINMIVTDQQAASCIDASIRQSPNTAVGISGELHTRVAVFATDDLLREAFSSSEDGSRLPLLWKDLEAKDIFIRVDQSRIGQWDCVLRLMLAQLIRTLERRPEKYSPEGAKIKPTLLLLDEFPQYGKVDELTLSMKVLRSKNVTFCLFCQSLADLDAIYGRDVRRTILDNCPFQAILGAHDFETQQYFSQRVGSIKVGHEGATESYDTGGNQTGFTLSMSEAVEPAILAHEFACMEDIVLLHPYPGGYLFLRKNTDYRRSPTQEPPMLEEKSNQQQSA